MTIGKYVHGYTNREHTRLRDQAETLSDILHENTLYDENEYILEVGCGVGAQTVHLARNSPQAKFTCIDISAESLNAAQEKIKRQNIRNVTFLKTDLFDNILPRQGFDHIFVCFVLEHLPDPYDALWAIKSLLKPGGTVTIIEGDHGSTFFSPPSEAADKAIRSLVELQSTFNGDAMIGRRLYPLLKDVGFKNLKVSPKMVYVDASAPQMVEGFTKNTFISMVSGVRNQVIERNIISESEFEQGITDLLRTTEPHGTFCYTFFKAVGSK